MNLALVKLVSRDFSIKMFLPPFCKWLVFVSDSLVLGGYPILHNL